MASPSSATSDGSQVSRSLLVALFGDFKRSSGGVSEEDSYSLFHKRSDAMGWLDTRRVIQRSDGTEEHVGSPGLWALHDAGSEPVVNGGSSPGPAFWFQVGIRPLSVGCALPTQALLRCVDDVVLSQGTFHPKVVQFVLPIQLVRVGRQHEIGLAPSVETLAWASASDSAGLSSVPATIEICSGIPLPQTFAQYLADDLMKFAAPILREPSVAETVITHFPVVAPDHFWGGPPQSAARIHCAFRGWTLERVGWLASFIADSCARNGVSHTVAVTISIA